MQRIALFTALVLLLPDCAGEGAESPLEPRAPTPSPAHHGEYRLASVNGVPAHGSPDYPVLESPGNGCHGVTIAGVRAPAPAGTVQVDTATAVRVESALSSEVVLWRGMMRFLTPTGGAHVACMVPPPTSGGWGFRMGTLQDGVVTWRWPEGSSLDNLTGVLEGDSIVLVSSGDAPWLQRLVFRKRK